jgi:hypothetical protein
MFDFLDPDGIQLELYNLDVEKLGERAWSAGAGPLSGPL